MNERKSVVYRFWIYLVIINMAVYILLQLGVLRTKPITFLNLLFCWWYGFLLLIWHTVTFHLFKNCCCLKEKKKQLSEELFKKK